ncbi:MAG: hypothetical protein [Circoviridae sp.]|nr:MAG: hypothetical protein [Circoviridae sp.]
MVSDKACVPLGSNTFVWTIRSVVLMLCGKPILPLGTRTKSVVFRRLRHAPALPFGFALALLYISLYLDTPTLDPATPAQA